MYAARAGILAHRSADPPGKFSVPGRRQRDPSGIRSRWAIVMHSQGTVRHSQGWNPKAGNRPRIEIVDAADDGNFLLHRHLAEDGVNPLLDILGWGRRSLRHAELDKN